MPTRTDPESRRAVAVWLLACCALVFVMVMVGGLTRLTHSGLSIVEWQPVMGTLPPLDDAGWQETFGKYKLTPEFQKRNFDMTLEDFKGIFWWEYFHRLLGRFIGVVFLLPFLYFLARRRIDRPLAWRLAVIFVLGGLQGAVGWLMVKSGLVDDPRVSSLRLAAHLGMAFLIYAAMLWTALGLLAREDGHAKRATAVLSGALTCAVFLQVLAGALVAGIHAGYAYNTFPLMNGQWIPDEVLVLEPAWKNFVYNMATVQLGHRLIAYLIVAATVVLWWRVRGDGFASPRAKRWAGGLAVIVVLQVCAGIATLLMGVPVPLAAIHQAGALVLFTCAIGLAHGLAGRGLQA